MEFSAVTSFFDNLQCRDAYSNALAFYGQLRLYDDSKRDSEADQRRIISAASSVRVPARRAIRAAGTVFLIGHGHPDNFQGATVRVGYIAHQAATLATVQSLDEACLGRRGTSAYAAKAWVKTLAFSQQSSHLSAEYHIHFGGTEVVAPNDIIVFDGVYHITRSSKVGTAGTRIALCEELEGTTREPASITTGVYSSATESVVGTVVSAHVLRLRWQALYAYGGDQADNFEAGDIQIVVAKASATMVAGARVALSDGEWQILSVITVGSTWVCRAAKHG